MKSLPSVAYYITAHGYGHGARSCDIIKALRRTNPELCIHVISDLSVEFMRSRVDLPMEVYRAGSFDVGMVQLDSIRVDVEGSLKKAESVLANRNELITREREFLRSSRVGLVVSDIPAIPIEAAKAEGLPALAIGNFAWDWIYEEYIDRDERWRLIADAFREGYGQADLLLRLPFSEPMAAFPHKLDIPLVATPGRNRRDEIARAYRIDPGKTWVLLSFTTLEWDQDALQNVDQLSDYAFLTVRPSGWPGQNFFAVSRHHFSYSDVIATADIVVSKPGYGILSECVVNGKPLVFAERTDFREYQFLEAGVKKHLRHQHIPTDELYSGNLQPYLKAIHDKPPPCEILGAGGDRIAAQSILEQFK